MIDAVFDCMVFLQAVTSDRGPSFACLNLVESNQVRLFISPAILAEIRDVLTRPKLRVKFPRLTLEYVDLFLHKLASLAVLVSDVPDSGMQLRDPGDKPYIDLAIAANVKFLVTRDTDLLGVMKETDFRESHPSLRIIDPIDFLHFREKL